MLSVLNQGWWRTQKLFFLLVGRLIMFYQVTVVCACARVRQQVALLSCWWYLGARGHNLPPCCHRSQLQSKQEVGVFPRLASSNPPTSPSQRSFPGARGRKHVCLTAGRGRAPGGRVRLPPYLRAWEAVHEPGQARRQNRDRDRWAPQDRMWGPPQTLDVIGVKLSNFAFYHRNNFTYLLFIHVDFQVMFFFIYKNQNKTGF